MEQWAFVASPVVPPAPARRRFGARTIVAGLLSVVLLAGAALSWHDRTTRVDDRPGQPQVALGGTYTVKDPVFRQSYTISLPAAPEVDVGPSSPAETGSMSTAEITPDTFMLMVRMGPEQATARAAVEAIDAFSPVTPVRETVVGGESAYARDFGLGGDKRLREFRFDHAGQVYGVGVIYQDRDPTGLNTALAALQTLRWNPPGPGPGS